MFHRELSKIKLNDMFIHLNNSLYGEKPKKQNHHNLEQFMITCQKLCLRSKT